jgi:uncharacterized protein (DUF1697 family)
MPALRAALDADGFTDVKTYVQSGNVVLSSNKSAERVARDVNALIKRRFGFQITVVVRSRAELAAVVRRNPLAKVARNPKRYLVTFLSAKLPREAVSRLGAAAAPEEKFKVVGREIYSWHPEGVGRSPLWERLAAKSLGISATSRNWSTVTTLLAMAGDSTDR